jgi:hypothetical protein
MDLPGTLISQTLTELENLEESMSALSARVEQHLVPFAQAIGRREEEDRQNLTASALGSSTYYRLAGGR